MEMTSLAESNGGTSAQYGGTNGEELNKVANKDFNQDVPPKRVQKVTKESETFRIKKNIAVASVSFFLILTSFHGVAILQSSLNRSKGSYSLASIYIGMFVSGLLFTNLMLSAFGIKQGILIGIGCYSTYILAQYGPSEASLSITGVILGFGASPMWTALATYLSTVSRRLSILTGQSVELVTWQVFSITLAFTQVSYASGSLIASSVLSVNANVSNLTAESIHKSCGINFCPSNMSLSSVTTLIPPNETDVDILVTIFFVLAVLAFSLCAIFLDPLHRFDDRGLGATRKSSLEALKATLLLFKNPKMMYLIPMGIFAGHNHGFLVADYNAAYVACALGIHMIGYAVISFGIFNFFGCLLLSLLIRIRGRVLVFFFGLFFSLLAVTLMCLWSSAFYTSTALLFIIPALWGLGDSIWQTNYKSLLGYLFPLEAEEAFSVLSVLESIGFLSNYGLQPVLCNLDKIILLVLLLLVSFLCYLVLEWRLYRMATQSPSGNGESVEGSVPFSAL